MALPAALRLTCAVTLDGTPLAGFPVERRPTGQSLERARIVRRADGDGVTTYTFLPVLFPLATALFTTEAPVRVSLNQQDDDALTLAPGGALFLLGATLTSLTTANPTTRPAPCTMLGLTA